MLQVHFVRENQEAVAGGLAKRNIKKEDIEQWLSSLLHFDDLRRASQQSMDDDKAKVNVLSKTVGELMRDKKTAEAESKKAEVNALKEKIKAEEETRARAEAKAQEILYKIPNVPHVGVPFGKSADDNKVMREWGERKPLPPDALPHWELIKKYDVIDFDLGTKITGAGFPVYKGKGAKLQRALISFFLEEGGKAGYREVMLPLLVNEASGYGTGQLPDKEGQMYFIGDDKFYLIPTAEVPITNLYRDVIVPEQQLPIKEVGYTPCFRREAGSWGAHVRGLNRLHQFDKVEIVQICKPEDSYAILEQMCLHVQGLLEKLELPYRKLLLCGSDMGFNAAATYDMEAWSAAQQRWLEVSSISNFETFQANRLKLRYKKDNKTQLLHTLNGSALALPRIVAALLENNQTADGIYIPKALRPYTGFEKIE